MTFAVRSDEEPLLKSSPYLFRLFRAIAVSILLSSGDSMTTKENQATNQAKNRVLVVGAG